MLLQASRLATSSTSVIEVMHAYSEVVDLSMADRFSELTTLLVASTAYKLVVLVVRRMIKTCKCDLRSTFVKKKQAVSNSHNQLTIHNNIIMYRRMDNIDNGAKANIDINIYINIDIIFCVVVNVVHFPVRYDVIVNCELIV